MVQYYWAKLCKKIVGSAIVDSEIHKTSKIEAGCHIVQSKFEKYSFCGYNCEIIHCTVGSYCSIANNVVIGGSNHPWQWVSMSPVFYAGRDSISKKFATFERDRDRMTIIGHDVWIGERVIIKQGVTVGTGAVIGMGSVVTKDVEPYTIIGGVPAQFIRKRFDARIIEQLLNIKWWEFSDEVIQKYAQFIKEPEVFIDRINRDNDQKAGG